MTIGAQRFLVPAYGGDKDAVRKGIRKAVELTSLEDSPQNVLIVVPTKSQLDHGVLVDVLGQAVAKALLKGTAVRLSDNAVIRCATLKTLRIFSSHDTVITCYLSADSMQVVEEKLQFKSMVVIPWTPHDVAEWNKIWNPTIIPNQLPENAKMPSLEEATLPELDPVVVEGLKIISQLGNLSTGISHPLDQGRAVALFRALKKSRTPFDPTAVRSWAVHNGWRANGAKDLGEVAQKIADGRRVQAPHAPNWGAKFIKQIKDRLEEAED